MSLTYMAGAAVMFFDLPSSDFLRKAFIGARHGAKGSEAHAVAEPVSAVPGVQVDQPTKTYDGFTLCAWASLSTSSTQAYLVNMRREVVHRWAVSFSAIWPKAPHVRGRSAEDSRTCIFGCYLYPNGDLLAVFHGMDPSANGYGIAKLDKDSKVIWKYDACVHHDVDVGDDGTIYAITHANVEHRPKGMDAIPLPWLVDYLVMLSPEGRELQPPLPILDALAESSFAPLLSALEVPRVYGVMPTHEEIYRKQDVLHTNSVHVLTRRLAPKFPGFQAGQVLISIRELSTLAVLDTSRRAVVWATRGPWRAQHDARFLENGNLLVFDNLGSPKSSRVLEYDLQTHAFPWIYSGQDGRDFFTSERGMSQRLANGNTLVVNSEGREVLEVSPSRQVVWSCTTPGFLCTARRYNQRQVEFLGGRARARP